MHGHNGPPIANSCWWRIEWSHDRRS